jgi:hypothetical protein
MRASTIAAPHFEHGGRVIARDDAWVRLDGGIGRSLSQAGAQRTLSHRHLRRRLLAGDVAYISTKEKIAMMRSVQHRRRPMRQRRDRSGGFVRLLAASPQGQRAGG